MLDLEQRSGVIARASGTACSIVRRLSVPRPMQEDVSSVLEMRASRPPVMSNSPIPGPSPPGRQDSTRASGAFIDSIYPSPEDVTLLTLDCLPPTVQVQWGGLVAARSIKLLASKNAQQRTRDKWWVPPLLLALLHPLLLLALLSPLLLSRLPPSCSILGTGGLSSVGKSSHMLSRWIAISCWVTQRQPPFLRTSAC